MRRLLFVVMLAACGDDGASWPSDARRAIDAREIDGSSNTCRGGKTIFLNRGGATFTHGDGDSAVANTASFVDGTKVLPAWPYSNESWAALKSCIATELAPFNVTLTDVDPGTA